MWPRDIVERLELPRFRNRALAGLYLDQAFLAGNGNYLRSEILWAAGVNPAAKPAALDAGVLEALARQTLKISRRPYRTRGVTVPPAQAKELKAQGLKYGEYRFFVFGRQGLPCYRCDSLLERATMASRNIFYCPTCQPVSQ